MYYYVLYSGKGKLFYSVGHIKHLCPQPVTLICTQRHSEPVSVSFDED
jgi:hypothetical protein